MGRTTTTWDRTGRSSCIRRLKPLKNSRSCVTRTALSSASPAARKSTSSRAAARTVPTAAERAGDFSGSRIPGCSSPVPIDPLTGAPFAGNRIPSDRLSPGGLLFLQLYALPNTTPAGGSCSNWVEALTTPLDYRQENIRVDYTVTNASRVMVRYTQDSWTNKAPNKFGNLWGDDPF